MDKSLNDRMEFDHVIYVDENGQVHDTSFYAPEIVEGELTDENWSLLTGYTGQYGYNGPHMHSSEFIGGRLEKDILATPGYYVALIIECWHLPEWECDPEIAEMGDCEPVGWAIAYRENFDND